MKRLCMAILAASLLLASAGGMWKDYTGEEFPAR